MSIRQDRSLTKLTYIIWPIPHTSVALVSFADRRSWNALVVSCKDMSVMQHLVLIPSNHPVHRNMSMRKLRTEAANKTCSNHRGIYTPLECTDHSLRI